MKIKSLKLKIISACLLFFAFQNQAFALLSFSVNSDEVNKTKILFIGFDEISAPKDAIKSVKEEVFERNSIIQRIKKNLSTTNLFEVIVENSTQNDVLANQNPTNGLNLVKKVDIEALPDFQKYNQAEIGAILVASFDYDESGNLEARLRLWDVLDQKQLFGKFYTASKDNYRKMANTISDEIFKTITFEKHGHFNSKIAYVAQTGPIRKRIKRVNIIDFDGENQKILTPSRDLSLTPVFSKKNDEIFYVKYFNNHPQIFSLDINNLRSQRVGGFRSPNFAPAINPIDSNKILLSAIIDGNSDIYELDILNNSAARLTASPAIDTTPSYSPDGNYIAFASDRSSGQQIYLMDKIGSSVKRLTKNGGSYAKPMWSPDGNFIAFTKMQGGEFFIGIMRNNGSQEKILASGYLVEGAKWSKSGRHLIYSKQRGKYGDSSIPRLFIVDVVTGFEYEIPTPEGEGATDPDWL